MRENSGLLRAVAVLLKTSSDIDHAPYFLLVILMQLKIVILILLSDFLV